MTAQGKILFAEDDLTLGTVVKDNLETLGFQVQLCRDGEEAMSLYRKDRADLLLLDVMMPRKDGFSLARDIRKIDKLTPILFLTSKSRTQDVVEGFEVGANDYIRKPFGMEELIVRIKSLLGKKGNRQAMEPMNIGLLSFNYSRQTLSFRKQTWELSHKESELLYQLSENRGQLLERNATLKLLWGDDDFFSARSMDVYISKLRKRLSVDPNVKIINIRAYGFKLIC